MEEKTAFDELSNDLKTLKMVKRNTGEKLKVGK